MRTANREINLETYLNIYLSPAPVLAPDRDKEKRKGSIKTEKPAGGGNAIANLEHEKRDDKWQVARELEVIMPNLTIG